MIGARNILIHAYEFVRPQIVREIVEKGCGRCSPQLASAGIGALQTNKGDRRRQATRAGSPARRRP